MDPRLEPFLSFLCLNPEIAGVVPLVRQLDVLDQFLQPLEILFPCLPLEGIGDRLLVRFLQKEDIQIVFIYFQFQLSLEAVKVIFCGAVLLDAITQTLVNIVDFVVQSNQVVSCPVRSVDEVFFVMDRIVESVGGLTATVLEDAHLAVLVSLELRGDR